jgi:hypothetical protein
MHSTSLQPIYSSSHGNQSRLLCKAHLSLRLPSDGSLQHNHDDHQSDARLRKARARQPYLVEGAGSCRAKRSSTRWIP